MMSPRELSLRPWLFHNKTQFNSRFTDTVYQRFGRIFYSRNHIAAPSLEQNITSTKQLLRNITYDLFNYFLVYLSPKQPFY